MALQVGNWGYFAPISGVMVLYLYPLSDLHLGDQRVTWKKLAYNGILSSSYSWVVFPRPCIKPPTRVYPLVN